MNLLDYVGGYRGLIISLGLAAIISIAVILIYILCTRKKRKNNKNVHIQAYTDELTKKGNRYLFYNDLDALIEKDKNLAVCFMDLDGFKQINDALGHDMGDELLIAVSNKFDESLPDNAKAYRLGGDEFAIIIKDIYSKEEVILILENLRNIMNKPVMLENNSIAIEYSLGVVLAVEQRYSRKELINYADNAMYYIKEHGGNGYYFHNDSLKAQLENNVKMEMDLKKAYENNEFGIALQPRINLEDTSKITFEALTEWNHPVLGKLDAAYFIAQAELMGLTIKLDEYALRNACEKILYFKEKGYENVQIAINMSNKNVFKKEFIDSICKIIEEYKLPANSLQIEMTGMIEVNKFDSYRYMFEKLSQLNVEIVINSLDINQESLELFAELPITEVKVSTSLLSEKMNDKVFSDLVTLAKDLGYKVIAGKISDEKKLLKAIECKVDKIQGNFLFKKLDENVAEDLLQNYGAYRLRIEEMVINANRNR